MTSINALSNRLFSLYDANHDGSISLKHETERLDREFQTYPDRDVITLTRYGYDKLFKAADTDKDGLVTPDELKNTLKLFDTNKDDELTNSGPFWNRKGELRNFDKAYPESWQIIERYEIPHPQPYPNYPGNPGYPHQPHYPHNYFVAQSGGSAGVSV